MTKKDYELIAKVFAHHRRVYGGRTDSVSIELIEDMVNALQGDNDRFDAGKFFLACGMEETEVKKYYFDSYGNLQKKAV